MSEIHMVCMYIMNYILIRLFSHVCKAALTSHFLKTWQFSILGRLFYFSRCIYIEGNKGRDVDGIY
jgi:hypothetical protein